MAVPDPHMNLGVCGGHPVHCRLSSSMHGLHLPDATALPSTGVDSQNCHLPSPCILRVLAWRPLALLPRSAQRTSCLIPSGLVLPLWGPVPRPHHPGPRASLLWPLWRLTALGLGSAALLEVGLQGGGSPGVEAAPHCPT